MKLILILSIFCITFSQKKHITLEDIFYNDDLRFQSLSGIQWTPEGNGYVYTKYNNENKGYDLFYYDIKSDKTSLYLDSKERVLERPKREKRFTLKNFFWSPADTDQLLVPRKNDLYLYKRANNKLTQLTNDELEERDPRYSPDGTKIAYIKKNNLFVFDIEERTETQVTFQGTEKVLIGKFDWVYEEEFGIRTGFTWSPNSESIAYFELTDAQTPRFPLVDFVPIKNTVEYLPYPKAGDDNSTVRIGIVEVDSKKSVFSDISSTKEELIPRIKWTSESDELIVFKMNRDQDYLDLFKTDTETGKSVRILHEEQKDGWIDIHDDLTFLDDKSFIWRSRKDGYDHLYLHEEDGSLRRQLTKGKWEITGVHGYDEDNKTIYFTAAKKSPLERELYSVTLKGKTKEVSKKKGYHGINMSPNFKYFIDYFSSSTHLPRVDLYKTSGKRIKVFIENKKDKLNKYALGKREILSFTTSYGETLNGFMIKPYNFDPKKTYPVLMYQYSGPGSQQVKNNYQMWTRNKWHHFLTQEQMIVFVMDPRGTGFRGRKFEQQTNHKLMQLEAEDLVEGASFLRTLRYIDKKKVGIWGWSYGGQMSSYVVMKYPEAFNLSIAVAPVVNYKNYDTIYSERYMSTPAKNNDNYDFGSTATFAKNLNKPFLLIHGTGDDNVHMSNSMQLVHELIKHRKQFESFFYPRSMHGMGYDYYNTQIHLYTLMTNFIKKHFQ